jgi:hypothetical protein
LKLERSFDGLTHKPAIQNADEQRVFVPIRDRVVSETDQVLPIELANMRVTEKACECLSRSSPLLAQQKQHRAVQLSVRKLEVPQPRCQSALVLLKRVIDSSQVEVVASEY